MKISRLYLKIYFYFLGILILTFLVLIPLVFFFSVEKPYKNIHQKRMLLLASVIEASLFNNDLQSTLLEISEKTNSDVAIYDKSGNVEISSGKTDKALSKEVIERISQFGFYVESSRINDRIFYVLALKGDKSPYFYISFLTSYSAQKDRSDRFFIWLIILVIILSILIYPLALHITRPLEKITEKAMNFSELEKDSPKKVLGDEISMLDSTFNHMASELINMIDAKKELLSDISHELGSPLSRMKIAAEIIEDKVKINKIPSLETVEGLSDDIDEMAKLVRELLEVSKMDLSAYKLKLDKIDLDKLISDTVKSFEKVVLKDNIFIKFETQGDLEEVAIDKDKISRVLSNLLLNAIKYSPQKGEIKILLKGEKDHFSLSVIDQGPGIKEENKDKIFDVFFREDSSRTRGTGGSGLGLAIAKKIVQLHNGKIWVENPGCPGAIITFYI